MRFFSSLTQVLPPVILLLALSLSEPPAFLLMAFCALLFHELGHIACFLLLTGRLPKLSGDRFGIRLTGEEPLSPTKEALTALGGPLCNFLLGFLLFRLGGDFGVSFGSIHLLYACFNLLPIADLDGGRLLGDMLCLFFSLEQREKIRVFFTALFTALFFFLSLFLFYFTGMGLCGVFFSVFSFPWRQLFAFDVLRENERKREN